MSKLQSFADCRSHDLHDLPQKNNHEDPFELMLELPIIALNRKREQHLNQDEYYKQIIKVNFEDPSIPEMEGITSVQK
jgi:hypothetical protein